MARPFKADVVTAKLVELATGKLVHPVSLIEQRDIRPLLEAATQAAVGTPPTYTHRQARIVEDVHARCVHAPRVKQSVFVPPKVAPVPPRKGQGHKKPPGVALAEKQRAKAATPSEHVPDPHPTPPVVTPSEHAPPKAAATPPATTMDARSSSTSASGGSTTTTRTTPRKTKRGKKK